MRLHPWPLHLSLYMATRSRRVRVAFKASSSRLHIWSICFDVMLRTRFFTNGCIFLILTPSRPWTLNISISFSSLYLVQPRALAAALKESLDLLSKSSFFSGSQVYRRSNATCKLISPLYAMGTGYFHVAHASSAYDFSIFQISYLIMIIGIIQLTYVRIIQESDVY